MTKNPKLQFTADDTEAQEAKLKQTLLSAAKSPLYRKLWKTANFKPENLQGINDFDNVPYLTRKNLFETTRTKPNNTCVGAIGHWFWVTITLKLTNGTLTVTKTSWVSHQASQD
jgi:phenylacetate-coenzyme A ligase PaaK-like adenylate-forming protein